MNSVTEGVSLEQLGQQFRAELAAGRGLTDRWLLQVGRRFVEQLLAEEVDERLGRASYERREGEQAGYRNGYKSRSLKTAEGRIEVDLPQVRGLDEPYRSAIWSGLSKLSPALATLVAEMYARGLSTRDIEELLAKLGEPGQEPAMLARSSVSRVTEVLWEEFEQFAQRDLSGLDVVYLFADAVYESLRQQAGCGQAILVSWGILSDGAKVLLHLSLGNKESGENWLEHFRSLVARKLPVPLTVTSDGAPGLIKAIEAIWPESERLRCWFHKMSNVLDKLPDDQRELFKSLLHDIRDAPDYATGKQRATELIEKFGRQHPSAMAALADDLEASLAHLKLPRVHQRIVRTTNLCERSFVEERRRSKTVPKFRGERECLKLVFATLWRTSERWRKVTFNELEREHLRRYIQARQAEGKKVRSLFAA